MSKVRKKRLLLLDRSQLTENMLKLLLADESVAVGALHELSELEAYARKYPIDLLVINSNLLAGSLQKLRQALATVPSLQALPKFFLCREDEIELAQEISNFAGSLKTTRPFHPEAFKCLLSGALL